MNKENIISIVSSIIISLIVALLFFKILYNKKTIILNYKLDNNDEIKINNKCYN